MPSSRKMVKHMLKILQHLMQYIQRVFDHFADAKHCRDNGKCRYIPILSNIQTG